MAFSVTEFKANGIRKGGARSALFSVELHWPTLTTTSPDKKSTFVIKGSSIPASIIGQYEVFYHGKGYKVAGDRQYDTWDTTIINDEDFLVRNALEDWMNLISNQKLNTRDDKHYNDRKEGNDAGYKKDLKVTQYSKDGKEITHYHVMGAWPSNLTAIPLDWATSDIQEFTCTWSYDWWYQETGHGTAPSGSTYTTHNVEKTKLTNN